MFVYFLKQIIKNEMGGVTEFHKIDKKVKKKSASLIEKPLGGIFILFVRKKIYIVNTCIFLLVHLH